MIYMGCVSTIGSGMLLHYLKRASSARREEVEQVRVWRDGVNEDRERYDRNWKRVAKFFQHNRTGVEVETKR